LVSSSVADAKRARFQADTPSSLSDLADLEWNFYSTQSGLTPASKYSITDHKMAYYKLNGAVGGSIRDIETAFFKAQGAVGSSYDDIRYDFYANRQFFIPSVLAGLELWLEADNISNAVLASDSFDRSKNLVINAGITTSWANWGTDTIASFASGGPNNYAYATQTEQAGNGDRRYVSVPGAFSLKPNTTYTASCWVNPSVAVNITVDVTGNTSGAATPNNDYKSLIAGSWQRIYTTFTTGPTADSQTYTFTTIAQALIPVGQSISVSGPQVELGSKPTAFVWGDATHLGTTDQGQSWRVDNGTMGLVNGKATAPSGTNAIAVFDLGTPDVAITETVVLQTLSQARTLFRYTDANNHYAVNVSQGTPGVISINKRVAGTLSVLGSASASVPLNVGVPYSVSILASGPLLIAIISGGDIAVPVSVNTIDVTYPTQTFVGINPNNASGLMATYDDFTVKTPTYNDGAVLPIWPDRGPYARHAIQTNTAKQPLFRSASSNLLSYDSATFELGSGGWFSRNNCTLQQTNAQSLYGSKSLAVYPATTGSYSVRMPTNILPVSPGDTISGEASLRAANVVGSFQLVIEWFDASNAFISANASGSASTVNNGWTRIAHSAVAPANAAYATTYVTTSTSFSGPRTVADGATTNGSTQITSATAVFVAGDVGRFVTGTGIPAGAYIASVTNATTAQLSVNATATGAAVSLTFLGQVHYLDNAGMYKGALPSAWTPPVTLPNGKSCVQFDGLDDVLKSAVGSWASATVYLVHQPIARSTTQIPFQANNGDIRSVYVSAANLLNTFAGAASNGPAVDGSWHDHEGLFTGIAGTTTVIVDGTSYTPGADSQAVGVDITIGADAAGARGTLGPIAAVLMFSRALTTTERQQVERYLRNKYATP